jgi:hypothetical protein
VSAEGRHSANCDCETCFLGGQGVYGRLNRIPGSPSVKRDRVRGGGSEAQILAELRELKALVMDLRKALLPPSPLEEH